MLISIVTFNHKAESPSYIIAESGIAIWLFCFSKTLISHLMIMLTFLFASLARGDQFPMFVTNFIQAYDGKAISQAITSIILLRELSGARIQRLSFSIRAKPSTAIGTAIPVHIHITSGSVHDTNAMDDVTKR